MTIWTKLWIIWLLFFCVIEGPALFNKTKGDTLSEHVWDWFSIKGKSRDWMLRRFILFIFMLWLFMHFVTGNKLWVG